MELNIVWFGLLSVIFAVFFLLEGFDYGVGMLLPFVGRTDTERRILINTIGPVWDGNEVWMITAGGALFAAFPPVYAAVFSGGYLVLFLLIMALAVRGVGFEFRSKINSVHWRSTWDWLIFIGSLVPAVIWGVVITSLVKGLPIDASQQFVGTAADFINKFTVAGGLVFTVMFLNQGMLYLNLKVAEDMLGRLKSTAYKIAIFSCIVYGGWLAAASTHSQLLGNKLSAAPLWIALASCTLCLIFAIMEKYLKAFLFNSFAIVLTTAAIFSGMYPNLVVSSLNSQWNMTIYNAASSPYTLKIMTIAAVLLVPVVIVYQASVYWLFKKRVSTKDLEY